ncbi:MAG: triple tyrosine motif-containing protein [Bacteroidales bacterium]|nr:triple tyrosine motif-containing protein [Bacteroidales bacterium]
MLFSPYRKTQKVLLFVGIFLGFVLQTFALEFTPIVTNFTKKDFAAANQNWSVAQDSHGLVYFGNNMGMLRFDGNKWELFRIPGNRIVRSIYISSDDRIYIGSFEEFGYFEIASNGELHYTSLLARLKGYKMMNDEVWSIIEQNGTVYFQSFTSLFAYNQKGVTGKRFSLTFLLFNKCNNAIYTHVDQLGFSQFNTKTQTFSSLSNPKESIGQVIATLPFDNKRMLLVTTNNGLFLYEGGKTTRFESPVNDLLAKANANRAVVTKDSIFVFGTILNGVFAVNKRGELLWQLNTSNFLQNNTVLGIFCDRNNNVWLALDKGISLLQTNSQLRYVSSFSPSIGSIYSVLTQGKDTYIGTNQGLYVAQMAFRSSSRSSIEIALVPQIKGQVWDLAKYDGQLFCGNNEQTYCIDAKQKVEKISPVKGGFCIKKGIINGQEVLVQGTYTNLCVYLKDDAGRWKFSHTIENFINPIRYLEIDYQGVIWASHLHKGLYRLQLTPDLKRIKEMKVYDSLDGKSSSTVNVFKIENRVVFTSGNGFYLFDDIRKLILPFVALNHSLRKFSTAYRVTPFVNNLYWFIQNQSAALVEVTEEKSTIRDVIQYASFPNESVDGYQNIVALSPNHSIICLDNSFALYNHFAAAARKTQANRLEWKYVKASNQEEDAHRFLSLNSNEERMSNNFNHLNFVVSYPKYSDLNSVYFSFNLDGFDKRWSDPKPENAREYVQLPHGVYKLYVRATTSTGELLGEINYTFEIRPPFYLTNIAFLFYFLLILAIIAYIGIYIRRQFHKKKEKFQLEQLEKHRKELEQSESQIIHLENEKLESELTLKSKELASSTMSIIKKNDILVQIREELVRQKELLGTQYPKKYFDKVTRIIDENVSSDDDWAIFQTNFDRIHENFFRHLRSNYPDLTSNDLRFCAYLRLNLATKDIANLMNISIKGVEAGRYRIRKKLNIPSEKSLTEFMIDFK